MSDRPTIVAGCDHAGLGLKNEILGQLRDEGYEVIDLGTHASESTDYPDYAHQVASKVAADGGLGLLVCGTGVGMCMAANRHAGIRAAVCSDTFSARMARQHNDANVLCLGSRVVGAGLAWDMVQAFLRAEFEGGRHVRRVGKIDGGASS